MRLEEDRNTERQRKRWRVNDRREAEETDLCRTGMLIQLKRPTLQRTEINSSEKAIAFSLVKLVGGVCRARQRRPPSAPTSFPREG